LDNQAGERVAELIFPLSSALFSEIGERGSVPLKKYFLLFNRIKTRQHYEKDTIYEEI
jgi:hypothetical protein